MDRTTRQLVIIAAFASSLLVVLVVLLWMLGGLRGVTAWHPAASCERTAHRAVAHNNTNEKARLLWRSRAFHVD